MLIHNNESSDVCPLCGSSKIVNIGDLDYGTPVQFSTVQINLAVQAQLWRCEECSSGFTQNRIPLIQAVALYSDGDGAERWSQAKFDSSKPAEQIEAIKKYCKSKMKVLDVGCNTGELLDFLKILGCETYGVEYSEASRMLIQKKGHAAFCSIADVNEEFDVITAFDLIEHLYDVPDFLSKCKKLLKKNGVLVILTGDTTCLSSKLARSRWWYSRYPEHVCFPSVYFFKNYSGFKLIEVIKTYASKSYIYPKIIVIKQILKKLIFYKTLYEGLPSLGSDHVFLVLKNE